MHGLARPQFALAPAHNDVGSGHAASPHSLAGRQPNQHSCADLTAPFLVGRPNDASLPPPPCGVVGASERSADASGGGPRSRLASVPHPKCFRYRFSISTTPQGGGGNICNSRAAPRAIAHEGLPLRKLSGRIGKATAEFDPSIADLDQITVRIVE